MKIFICYARADKEFASQLVEDLNAYELTIWMDVRSIPHGANWDFEVQKGLDSSDTMLVLLTPAAAASQNVADEWSYFIERDKKILPLMVEPCEVPFRLSRRQRVDLTGDYHHGFEQLLKSLDSPPLKDPDGTQKILIRPVKNLKAPAPSIQAVGSAASSPSISAARVQAAPVAPEVGVRLLPVIWGSSYHWFRGMGPEVMQGDAMINAQELKLIPHARPIVAIPLHNLVSAKLQYSVDEHLKITYYGPDSSFQSLELMGAPRNRRKEITREIQNLLKHFTGRSLE